MLKFCCSEWGNIYFTGNSLVKSDDRDKSGDDEVMNSVYQYSWKGSLNGFIAFDLYLNTKLVF